MTDRPVTVLVAALGGEGGGVLTDWIVAAAMRADLPVQSTSIPGVAQRTGATTYYTEVFPRTNAELGRRRPLLALYPSPGGIDVAVASELVEAGRALENGFVTPDRTLLVAATHRIYAVVEKQAMADGRFDGGPIFRAARELARRAVLFDLRRSRETETLSLNAVLLGVIAGAGALPIPRAHFEAAIRDSGIAVDANLRAFALGIEIGEKGPPPALAPEDAEPAPAATRAGRRLRAYPEASVALVEAGVQRLADYQDEAYADLYLDRLAAVAGLDREGGALTAEVARQLALWMSYEDVIRVADLKSRPERLAGIREEVRAKPGEPVLVTEYFKPGVEEIAAILPLRLGRSLRRWGERRRRAERLHLRMRIKSSGVFGFLRLRLLAAMRPLRRRSLRFAEEQAAIEEWLAAIARAAAFDFALAREIARLPQLRKGYGDTHRRGVENYRRVFDGRVLPALAAPTGDAAQRLGQALAAALADPEGKALARALAEAGG